MIILLIAIAIILIFIILLAIKNITTCNRLKEWFSNSSVIVYGAKGKGKDILFQKVINLRKKRYASNVDYGNDYLQTSISELTTDPNTYEDFINGNLKVIQKNKALEGVDYYLSDGGVYLPCQYDYLLHKKYPSLPIYYALSRHLYNQNIHINTQNLERIWKALREQADRYIKCKRVIKLPFIMICNIRFYEKYDSARQNLLPLGSRIMNKYSKATMDQYEATNGLIKDGTYIILKRKIKYDTRIYHEKLFGINIKEWKELNN